MRTARSRTSGENLFDLVMAQSSQSIGPPPNPGRFIFAALAEFERELIAERTVAGLASARARGRKGGRPFKMTAAKLRLAMAAMGQPETKVSDLCQELGITRQTLYRHISPSGQLRSDGTKLLSKA
jgi:DNA invertase Pin-like site-specific DNA recombinase